MKITFQNAKLLLFACAALFSMSFTKPVADSTPRPWELLGERKVDYALDRDEIPVTIADGRFTAIKIKVKAAPINMHKLVIHYGNGETEDIELRNNFAAGSESRVIDLPGKKRIITKVVFWYDTKDLAARKGVVELWGRR